MGVVHAAVFPDKDKGTQLLNKTGSRGGSLELFLSFHFSLNLSSEFEQLLGPRLPGTPSGCGSSRCRRARQEHVCIMGGKSCRCEDDNTAGKDPHEQTVEHIAVPAVPFDQVAIDEHKRILEKLSPDQRKRLKHTEERVKKENLGSLHLRRNALEKSLQEVYALKLKDPDTWTDVEDAKVFREEELQAELHVVLQEIHQHVLKEQAREEQRASKDILHNLMLHKLCPAPPSCCQPKPGTGGPETPLSPTAEATVLDSPASPVK